MPPGGLSLLLPGFAIFVIISLTWILAVKCHNLSFNLLLQEFMLSVTTNDTFQLHSNIGELSLFKHFWEEKFQFCLFGVYSLIQSILAEVTAVGHITFVVRNTQTRQDSWARLWKPYLLANHLLQYIPLQVPHVLNPQVTGALVSFLNSSIFLGNVSRCGF